MQFLYPWKYSRKSFRIISKKTIFQKKRCLSRLGEKLASEATLEFDRKGRPDGMPCRPSLFYSSMQSIDDGKGCQPATRRYTSPSLKVKTCRSTFVNYIKYVGRQFWVPINREIFVGQPALQGKSATSLLEDFYIPTTTTHSGAAAVAAANVVL